MTEAYDGPQVGWCHLMGLAALMLFGATLLVVRNQRVLAAWNTRQEENERRAAKGLPPRTRRRRRKNPHRAHHRHQAAIDASTSSAHPASTPVQAPRTRSANPRSAAPQPADTQRHQPATLRNTGRMSDPPAKITKAQT